MVDYIKREDALSYLPQYPLDYSFQQTQAFMKGFIQLRKCIVSCPTADVVERKHGKWKELTRYGMTSQKAICECSVCGGNAWVYDDEKRRFKYCPHCGAELESADDV